MLVRAYPVGVERGVASDLSGSHTQDVSQWSSPPPTGSSRRWSSHFGGYHIKQPCLPSIKGLVPTYLGLYDAVEVGEEGRRVIGLEVPVHQLSVHQAPRHGLAAQHIIEQKRTGTRQRTLIP